MDAVEQDELDRFIVAKRTDRVFILKKGTLEDYLPDGLKSKDIDQLITFLSEADYWDRLEGDDRKELAEIAEAILASVKDTL